MARLQNFRRFVREAFSPEPADRADTAAFVLFLVFIAAAPWLYGTGERLASQAMGGGSVLPTGNLLLKLFAFMVAAVALLSKARARSLRPLTLPFAATTGIALLAIFQLLPLSERILERIAPVNVRIYHESAEILGRSGRKPLPARISIAPTETLDALLLVLTYAALFLAAAILLHKRLRRRVFAAVLLMTGVTQVLLAAILKSPADRAHGTFVNPNHFAGYLEIILAMAFGVLWAEVLTNSERARHAEERSDRFEKRLVPLLRFILLWGVVAVGIGLTQSKGGILSAGFTIVVLLAMASAHRRAKLRPRLALAAALAVLAGVLFVVAAAGATPFLRFLEADPREIGQDLRVQLWTTSLRAWQEFPIAGSGLGTFREAFRRFQPRHLLGRVEHAHSDSLQLLVTGGAIGATLGVLLFVSLFVQLFRAWRAQKHREESAVTLVGFGALLSLTLHGLVDFNLSIPVIPATLACVLGMAWAAGTHR